MCPESYRLLIGRSPILVAISRAGGKLQVLTDDKSFKECKSGTLRTFVCAEFEYPDLLFTARISQYVAIFCLPSQGEIATIFLNQRRILTGGYRLISE